MTVHRKCAIVLVIFCARSCMMRSSGSGIRDNNVSEDSNEDENLKQALVLVDLLKNEYVKALRENLELRARTTHTEESTCAPGDRPTSMSESVTTDQYTSTPQQPATIPGGGRRMAAVTPFEPSPWRYDFRPYNFFRRRIPVDYYYSNGIAGAAGYDYPVDNFRRQATYRRKAQVSDSDNTTTEPAAIEASVTKPKTIKADASNPKVPYRRQAQTGVNSTTESGITESVTTKPDTKEPDIIEPDITEPDAIEPDAIEPDAIEPDAIKPDAIEPDALEPDAIEPDAKEYKESENTLPNKEEDPIEEQVISELKQELKLTTPEANTHTYATTNGTAKTTKTNFHLIKPTLKIYLGGSTRYPLPLPENHAFCYTNPRNPMCRTSI